MKVYEVSYQSKSELCHPVHDSDWEYVRTQVNGVSRESEWRPVEVRIVSVEADGTPFAYSDAPWFAHDALVFRPRACAALASWVGSELELLPLQCFGEVLKMVNPLKVLPALDEAKSKIRRLASGKPLSIAHHEFLPEVVSTANIFKLSGWRASPIFVTEPVKAAWTRTRVRGLDFRLVWPLGMIH